MWCRVRLRVTHDPVSKQWVNCMTDTRKAAIASEIPRLRRYARALLGADPSAEDLVQDCLERAIAGIASWREGDSPRKWLLTILHNVYVDGVRRSARRPPHVGLDAAGNFADQPGRDGVSAGDIDRALQALSPEQRQVVLLVGVEGLSYAETAEVLSVPVGTVMSRLARGRDRLRLAMEGGGGGYDAGSTLRRVK